MTEEKQESQEAKPEGEQKAPTQADLDALKSTLDGKIAELTNENKTLSKSLSDRELQLTTLQEQIEQAGQRIELDEDATPEQKAAVKKLQDDLAKHRQYAVGAFAHWQEAASERAALRLAIEHDVADQVPALTKRFAAAAKDGEERLKLEMEKAELEILRDKVEQEKKGGAGKDGDKPPPGPDYDENVPRGRAPASVVAEMEAIDVTTPAGMAEWEKQRATFAKKAKVPLP